MMNIKKINTLLNPYYNIENTNIGYNIFTKKPRLYLIMIIMIIII